MLKIIIKLVFIVILYLVVYFLEIRDRVFKEIRVWMFVEVRFIVEKVWKSFIRVF